MFVYILLSCLFTLFVYFYSAGDDTITTNSSEDLEGTLEGTLGGSINNISDITTTTDEHKIVFERTLRRSRIAFKSKHDILKTVTGRMILLSGTHPNAFGATDLVGKFDGKSSNIS